MASAHRRPRVLLAALVIASIASADRLQAQSAQRHDRLETLRPGAFVVQKQVVPVNIVLIGYDRGQIDESALLAELPATYTPVVRFPRFYGLNGRDLGLQFRFKYNVVRKGRSFEDRFVAFLSETGTSGPLSQCQHQ